MNTKIEFGFNKMNRIDDLADMASVLFPNNKRHQKAFLAIFIELKYTDNQFLSDLKWIGEKYKVSKRVFEIVRAKMRRLGLIDHVSRFNAKYGYREGWVFSSRFKRSVLKMEKHLVTFIKNACPKQETKDRVLFSYF